VQVLLLLSMMDPPLGPLGALSCYGILLLLLLLLLLVVVVVDWLHLLRLQMVLLAPVQLAMLQLLPGVLWRPQQQQQQVAAWPAA
jgi:hypothetical protein